MTDFYVDNAAGSDANSGSSEGSAQHNGTAATRSTNVYTLDGSPDLSGITDGEDTIAIVGETSGQGVIGDTIFLITAHDDGADTVTVSPTPTGGTSGLTWAIGGGFATFNKVVNNAALAGDDVYVKGGTIYTEASITTALAGSSTAPIRFFGYTSVITDNGQVVFTPATGTGFTHSLTGAANLIFNNMRWDNCSNTGFNGGNSDNIHFHNCGWNGNSGRGVFGDNTYMFARCESVDNTSQGTDVDANAQFHGCINGNNGIGYWTLGGGTYYRCVGYGADSTQRILQDTSAGVNILGCTFDSQQQARGLQVDDHCTIVDTILYDSDTWGVEFFSTAQPIGLTFFNHNLVYGNTTGVYEITNRWIGQRDVAQPPGFTDEAGEDYTLADTSAAVDVGMTPGNLP